MNLFLIGRSGSGKGTQAELLTRHFNNFFYISSGALFRELAQTSSDTGKRIAKVVNEGGLPFDTLATALWMRKIAFEVQESQGVLTDGAPRRLNEAKDMDGFMDFLGRKKRTFYILIDISRHEALERLTKRRVCKKCKQVVPWVGEFKKLKKCDKCGGELVARPDDKPSAIKNRLDYFDTRVTETIRYLKRTGRLIKINGEQSIENVSRDILKALR